MRRILFAAAMALVMGGCADDGFCPDLVSEPTMPGVVSEPTMPAAPDEEAPPTDDPCAAQQQDDDDQIKEPCGPNGCGAKNGGGVKMVGGFINEPIGP